MLHTSEVFNTGILLPAHILKQGNRE